MQTKRTVKWYYVVLLLLQHVHRVVFSVGGYMLKRSLPVAAAICFALYALTLFSAGALAADKNTYCVEVDIDNQITTVYRQSDRAIVRQMLCSSGREDWTPLGTFQMEKSRPGDRSEWYYIGKYACYVKYPTRIQGKILFHSLPYSQKDMDSIDQQAITELGTQASHGCIRLRWQDACWISQNCPVGTTVKIFTGATKKEALRALLLRQSYVSETGLSYQKFLEGNYADFDYDSLDRGSTNEMVNVLQQRLIGLGFLKGNPTGTYDDATVAAVRRYQLAAGVTASGVASHALVERIMAEDVLSSEYATLTPGCSGTLVAKLQRALKDIGFYHGEVDGEYGDALADAMSNYCSSMGITPSENITPEMRANVYRLLQDLKNRFGDGQYTMVVLIETTALVRQETPLYADPSELAEQLCSIAAGQGAAVYDINGQWCRIEYAGNTGFVPASTLMITEPGQKTVNWGIAVGALGEVDMNTDSIGDGVLALQDRLRDLGFFDSNSSSVYDADTADAVSAYQYVLGLDVTGSASVELQNAIAENDEVTGTLVELRPGMSSPAVSALQRVLGALQFFTDEQTGVYDEATAMAVRRFCRANGLPERNIASPAVQDAAFNIYYDCQAQYGSGHYALNLSPDGKSAHYTYSEATVGQDLIFGSDDADVATLNDVDPEDLSAELTLLVECDPVPEDSEDEILEIIPEETRPDWIRPRPWGM